MRMGRPTPEDMHYESMSTPVLRMSIQEAQQFRDKLFTLPRELRDMVYDYAWQGTHIYYQDQDLDLDCAVDARYLDTDLACCKTWELPPWTTIHPQIREETLQMFHRNAEFSVGDGNEYTIPYCNKFAPEQNLLSITKARHITIFGQSGSYVWDLRDIMSPMTLATAGMTTTVPKFLSIKLSDIQQEIIRRLTGQNTVRTIRLAISWEQAFYAPEVRDGHGLEALRHLCANIPNVNVYSRLVWNSISRVWFPTQCAANKVFMVNLAKLSERILGKYPRSNAEDGENEEEDEMGHEAQTPMALPHWQASFPRPQSDSPTYRSTIRCYGKGKTENKARCATDGSE
jgi:hypothetical protein